MLIVDHLKQWAAPDEGSINEAITLDSLAHGLAALAAQVAQIEAPIRTYETENRKHVNFFGFGICEQFGMAESNERLLPCLFHWFGNTICNYARLVGFVGGLHEGRFARHGNGDPEHRNLIRRHCSEYVDSVPELGAIKFWRNKVFAHFAMTDPFIGDNPALLEVSIASPVEYADGRFRVGTMISSIAGAEIEMPSWSVTEVFESLAPRYWPQLAPQ